ncbi:MAG: hypothetical protein DWH81_03775, partial [Planctomycetota bacterium]
MRAKLLANSLNKDALSVLSPRETPITGGESIDLMSGALRFLRSVRSRFPLVILSLIICLGLGASYYVTAERKYESSAKLMILQMGGDVVEKDGLTVQSLQEKMPEFEHILTGDSTLKETLRNLPDEHRIDFAGVRQDRWLAAFRTKLSVSTIRKTSIMSVSFRSKSPATAYSVVEEVLNSFIAEVNRIHQDERSEDMKLLTQQRETTERELETRQKELLQLQSQAKEIYGTGDKSVNVLIDRILRLNQDWILKSKEASETQALLAEMEDAQQRGEDLTLFLNRVDPTLAAKINEKRSGVDSSGSFVTNKLQEELSKLESQLDEKLAFLGERHPEIIRIRNEIVVRRKQLQERPQTVDEMLNAQDIGAMLLARVRRDAVISMSAAQRMRETLDRESSQASEKSGLFASVEAKGQEVVRLRDYLAVLADRMKSARLGQSNSIRAKVTVEPEVNMTPVSPRLGMTIFACVVMGISISFCVIYILDLIDDRFRSPDDLRRELGAPVLAMVRKLVELPGQGLDALYPFARPNAIESESFRT